MKNGIERRIQASVMCDAVEKMMMMSCLKKGMCVFSRFASAKGKKANS